MSFRRFLSAISAFAVSAVLIAGFAQPAFAQEDEDQPNFMSRLLGSVGLLALPGPEIDTSERPPLVVPPMTNYVQPNIAPNPDLTPRGQSQQNPWDFSSPRQEHLPPPQAADNRPPQQTVALPLPQEQNAARLRNPDFPVDPELRAAQKRKKQKKNYTNTDDENWDRLRADQLRSAGPISRADRPGTNTLGEAAYNRASPKDLNAPSSFFGMFKSKEEPIKFEGEPERRALTQPPAGYLTPSANAPYGVLPKEERNRTKTGAHQNMPNAGDDQPR